MPTRRIKNCGLKTLDAMKRAVETGATHLGFIHYPPSSRYISVSDAAALAPHAPADIEKVAVMVNPDDAQLDALFQAGYATMLQLHGDESPERVTQIAKRSPLRLIKAIGVASAADVAHGERYAEWCEALLFDTKHTSYGGTGESFDWSLLSGLTHNGLWFLSGGLTAENVGEALRITHAPGVDVSSGIEREKGVKDLDKISRFNQTVQDVDATH